MSSISTNDTDLSWFSNYTVKISELSEENFTLSFRFWITLSFNIPSIICYLFVLIYILSQKIQRQALHNHSILVLLFIAFAIVLFDYSWTIDSYRREGHVWLKTVALCQVWWLLDFGFYNACTVVLAWASFERHILIFHSNLVATKRRVILIHYLPLCFILIYLSIFYIYVIFFPPCKNEYDFTLPLCGNNPCYLLVRFLSIWESIIHSIIPTFFIAIFNVALLIRVLRQKRHHRQDWRKCRKLAFQLLSISALYLSLNLPMSIVILVHLTGHPNWGIKIQPYFFFLSGLIQPLLPFICLTGLCGVWEKIKMFFIYVHRRIIPAIQH